MKIQWHEKHRRTNSTIETVLREKSKRILTIEEVKHKGINSNIYKLNLSDNSYLALKIYREEENNQRFKREIEFLEYANKCRIESVPKIIEKSKNGKWSAIEWIGGKTVKKLKMEDMLQISNFLEELNRGKEKAQLSEAKESCLDIKVFGISSMKKIEERKNSLINNQEKLSSKTFDTAIMTMNNCTKILH